MTAASFRPGQERLGPSVALREEGTPAQPAPQWPITRPDPGCANAPTPSEAEHSTARALTFRDTVWSEVAVEVRPAYSVTAVTTTGTPFVIMSSTADRS